MPDIDEEEMGKENPVYSGFHVERHVLDANILIVTNDTDAPVRLRTLLDCELILRTIYKHFYLDSRPAKGETSRDVDAALDAIEFGQAMTLNEAQRAAISKAIEEK